MSGSVWPKIFAIKKKNPCGFFLNGGREDAWIVDEDMKSESYKSSMPSADEVVLFRGIKQHFESKSPTIFCNKKKNPCGFFFNGGREETRTPMLSH